MIRLKLRLLGLVTGINLALGILVWLFLFVLWPHHYFKWYPSIPAYFWLMGVIMILVLNRRKSQDPNYVVTAYMVIRMTKLLSSLVFLWLYTALVHEYIYAFGLTLMLFYFIHLAIESYVFYLYEKRRMIRKKAKENRQ